jgi:RHS repeat-associated protein
MRPLRAIVFVFLLCTVGFHSAASAADGPVSAWLSKADAAAMSGAFSLDGVAGYVEGKAHEAIQFAISKQGSDWFCDAVATVADRVKRGEAPVDLNAFFFQNAQTKEAVTAELTGRLKAWLPEQVRAILVHDLLGNAVGEAAMQEAAAIADRVIKELDTSLNDQVDAFASKFYDEAVGRLQQELFSRGVPQWMDIADLRGSIERAFQTGTIAGEAADALAKLVGDGTVAGIRARLTDALDGVLPPEALEALAKGPEAFERYVEEAKGYLPGSMLEKLRSSVLNRPLIQLPTPAYAAILAGTAAGHYARAFAGAFVDAYELRRAAEVTRVMVWQLENKDWLNLSIMQLGALARDLAQSLGMGLPFEGLVAKLKEPLARLQSKLDRVDALIAKPLDQVSGELARLGAEIGRDLTRIQAELMAPLKDGIAKAQSGLDRAAAAAEGALPEGLNGIPASWEELKEKAGIDGVLGEVGEWTPNDALDRAGLADAAAKVRDDFSKVNDRIADAIATGAAEALEAAHLLGPAARILDAERVPARNPSRESALDPVLLHSGEYVQTITDLLIPGRGIDFRFTRIYRSAAPFLGELGVGWTHAYAERLLPWNDGGGDGLTYVDEEGQKSFFRADGKGFASPPGVYTTLVRVERGYELRHRDGMATAFDGEGRPQEKRDRYGNRLRYEYDPEGRVAALIDVFGRRVAVERREDGLITAIADFAGRRIRFDYNDAKELIGVASPATPDFPKGKLTAYRYDAAEEDASGVRRLSMIMDPKGEVWLRNRYDAEGRVAAQRYGDGAWMTVQYQRAEVGGMRAWVTDPLGRVRLYEHDAAGHLTRRSRWVGDRYVTLETHAYDADGERTYDCLPSGRCTSFLYGDGEARGRLMRIDALPAGGGTTRVTAIEREPRFGRVARVIFPTGVEERILFAEDAAAQPLAHERRDGPEKPWVRTASFRFNAMGQIVEEADARSALTRYEYFSEGDPAGSCIGPQEGPASGGGYLKAIVRDAAGVRATTSFRYDPIGNVVGRTAPDGVESRYVVNALNEIVREEEPGRWPIRYAFDANDNLASAEILRPGAPIVQRFEHGSLDRLVAARRQISQGQWAVTSYQYDGAGNLVRAVQPEGDAVVYEYDEEDRVRCIVRGADSLDRSRACVARDEDGEIVEAVDGAGAAAKYELNGFGERIAEVDALRNRREWERDGAGRIIGARALDAAGVLLAEEHFSYEGDRVATLRQRLWRDDPAESRRIEERWEYDAAGDVVAALDPAGVRTAFEYDGLGAIAAIRHPGGSREVFRRDASGRVVEQWIDGGSGKLRRRAFSYDAAGRLAAAEEEGAAPWRYEYDGMGELARATDPAGVVTTYERDDLGRRTKLARGEGDAAATTRFAWDRDGRLARLVDPAGRATAFGYDDLGRLILERFPDGSERRSSYDGEDRVVGVESRAGHALAIARDLLGRIVARSALPSPDLAGTLRQRFAYDGLGRLTWALDENDPEDPSDDAVTRLLYDSLSRPIAESSGAQGEGETAAERWIARSFDDAGRVVALRLPDGTSFYRAYDAAGRATALLTDRGPLASIERDAAGAIARTRLPGGAMLSIERDGSGRELSRRYAASDGRELARWEMRYDGSGRIVSERDALAELEWRYGREALGRLTLAEATPLGRKGGAAPRRFSYRFNQASDIVAVEIDGASDAFTYNELGELARVDGPEGETRELAYDGDGNLASDGALSYRYDALGRLTQVLEGEGLAVQNSYDAFDRKRSASGGDTSWHFIWDGWDLVSLDDEQEGTQSFAMAEELGPPLARLAAGEIAAFLVDRLGSVRGVVAAGGEIAARCDFDPYGAPLAECDASLHPFGFAGSLRGLDPRLLALRHRHYDPALMRFVSPDPLGYKLLLTAPEAMEAAAELSFHNGAGSASRATFADRPLAASPAYDVFPFGRLLPRDAASEGDGETNLYLYASGDPVTFTDPLGLASLFFDRAAGELALYDGDGGEITRFATANRTTNPTGDPMRVGQRGPFPDGTVAVGVPEFYSQSYREDFYRRFGLGDPEPGESIVTGGFWAGTKVPGYNVSFGLIRFRAGAPTRGIERIAWNRGLFLHGGRYNRPTARTHGCLRTRDDELEVLAANAIELRREGDPITSLTVE